MLARSEGKVASCSGALCVAVAFFLGSAVARAEAEPSAAPVPLLLEVQADGACMSHERVKERLVARTHRAELLPASSKPAAPAARVRITQRPSEKTPSDGDFRVLLELESRGGKSTKRELVVRDCSEANDAAALIVALWLDEVEPARPHEEVAPTAAPPATTLPERSAASDEQQDASDAERGMGFRFRVGLLAQGSLGPAPEPLLGPALLVTGAYGEEAIVSLELRLTAAYQWALSDTKADFGTAQFRMASLTLDACPLRFGGESVAVRPCATGIFGALEAEGRDTVDPESDTRPYSALGGTLVVTGELDSGVGVVVSAGASFPLSRDRFEFAPVVFHEVPALVGAANLGISYRFP